MTKLEAIAYLRKKVLMEKLAINTDTNPEAAEELTHMEDSPESEKKNLTNPETNVS